jgi:hypothetical protein
MVGGGGGEMRGGMGPKELFVCRVGSLLPKF